MNKCIVDTGFTVMKRIIIIIFINIIQLSGNPILWNSEVINEYQIEPLDSQYLEFRWVATGHGDTSYNNPFDIYGTQIITPSGTVYVDTSIIIYDSSRIMIGSSMVQGIWQLPIDSGSIEVSNLLDYLVWNPDPTPQSGTNIDSGLGMMFFGDHLTTLPPYLNRYKAIYACLGVYPNNYRIDSNSTEALLLREYLENGGTMYLEGGDVWCYDPTVGGFDFGPYFSILPVGNGYNDMGPIVGEAGTFMHGKYFEYGGENNWMDRIIASDSGIEVLRDSNDNYFCGVADNRDVHQTLGTSFELGLLTNGTSTLWELLMEIQLFFGYSEWTMIPFRDTVFYPGQMPVPQAGHSASVFYVFYYNMGYGGYYERQDWYIDSTPTFGSSNDDYPGCIVSGYVYDSVGLPLSGAQLTAALHEQLPLIDVVEKPPFYSCCTTYSQSDGGYVFDSLLPWQYEICAYMGGYEPDTIMTSYLKALEPLTDVNFYLTVGIDEFIQNRLDYTAQVYPNPFGTVFTLLLTDPIPYIEIYDITGRRRMLIDNRHLERSIVIDGRSLPSGIYFIPSIDKKFKIIKH